MRRPRSPRIREPPASTSRLARRHSLLQDLSPTTKLSGNDYLRLASTFHSLHAISKQLSPVQSGGIQVVDAPAFSLHCFESPTGVKFFVTAKPKTQNVAAFLKKVYEFYADYVLKVSCWLQSLEIDEQSDA